MSRAVRLSDSSGPDVPELEVCSEVVYSLLLLVNWPEVEDEDGVVVVVEEEADDELE